MSMSLDIANIPQQTLNIVTEGIVASEVCFADTVCLLRKDVKTLAGSTPYLGSSSTVRKDENRDMAPGSEAKAESGSMGSVKYNCLAQMGFFQLNFEDVMDMSAYSLDAVGHYVQEARKSANLSVDLKLDGVLSSTTLNNEFSATGSDGGGAWDVYATSTPYRDIRRAAFKIPGADTVIVGYDAMNILANHPDTQARLSNFSSNGYASNSEVLDVIRRVLNNPNMKVLFFDTFYDIKKEGLGFETDYCFKSGFWIGKGNDLQLFDPNHQLNNRSFSQPVERKRAFEIGHTRYVDIIRHQKATAATITNIKT